LTPHPTSSHKNQAQQLPQHYSVGKQLTINKVTAIKIKRNDKFTRTVIATWELALKKEKENSLRRKLNETTNSQEQ